MMENRAPRPENGAPESATKSWKTMFKKSKIEPARSSEVWCKSVFVEIERDRVIRVLQTMPLQSFTNESEERKMFFVHGVGGSADIWKNQMIYFNARGYSTISLDLLGHGHSSKPRLAESYSFENLAKDVLQIFDMFHGKRNILIGHSYGASFVTLIASERKRAVSKVILISGGPPTSLKPERFSVFCLPLVIFGPLKSLVVHRYRSLAFHSNASSYSGFSLPAYALKAIMQGQNWPQGDEEYHSDLLVPVILIYGKSDKFVTLEEEQWTEEIIYGSHLEVVEDAGHMVMIEKPDVVNEIILRFLNRDTTTRSMVDLSLSPVNTDSNSHLKTSSSCHVISKYVNKDLLIEEVPGASRSTSRPQSRLSRRGSEKRTKIVL